MWACVCLRSAVCVVAGAKQVRRYTGIFKNRKTQTRESARKNRERHHAEQPVEWLRQSDPSTVIVKAVGQPMSVKQALLQEAIDTAHALVDGEGPVRGGPWANSKIRERSHAEAALPAHGRS